MDDQELLCLWLIRHALIEYAAQRHPQRELLELGSMLDSVIDRIPNSAALLPRANALVEQFAPDPFRSGKAARLACSWTPRDEKAGR